jgi:hypothetical protein
MIAESDAERLREAVERYQSEAARDFHDTADRLRSGAADERLRSGSEGYWSRSPFEQVAPSW